MGVQAFGYFNVVVAFFAKRVSRYIYYFHVLLCVVICYYVIIALLPLLPTTCSNVIPSSLFRHTTNRWLRRDAIASDYYMSHSIT